MSDAPETPARSLPWLRFAIVAVLVSADLWTKSAVFEWLSMDSGEPLPTGVEWWKGNLRYSVIGDFLGFMLSENKGAAWGFGDSMPYVLVGARIVASVVLTVMLWRISAAQPWTRAALTLILAGALGNLWDNLTRTPPDDHPFGAVRDFIHVYFTSFNYHFPTFNVADSCITVGATILIVAGLFGRDREPEPAPAEA